MAHSQTLADYLLNPVQASLSHPGIHSGRFHPLKGKLAGTIYDRVWQGLRKAFEKSSTTDKRYRTGELRRVGFAGLETDYGVFIPPWVEAIASGGDDTVDFGTRRFRMFELQDWWEDFSQRAGLNQKEKMSIDFGGLPAKDAASLMSKELGQDISEAYVRKLKQRGHDKLGRFKLSAQEEVSGLIDDLMADSWQWSK